jgi:hypothetical protein
MGHPPQALSRGAPSVAAITIYSILVVLPYLLTDYNSQEQEQELRRLAAASFLSDRLV